MVAVRSKRLAEFALSEPSSVDANRGCFLSLAPRAGRGCREAAGEGALRGLLPIEFAEAAPHPDLLPVKNGEKEERPALFHLLKTRYAGMGTKSVLFGA